MVIPWGGGGWGGGVPGMVTVAETFFFSFFLLIYSNKPYLPSGLLDGRTEPLMLMKRRIEIQANIQGIHCIIKATTGIKDRVLWWNLLFPGKNFFFFSLISTSLLSGLYLVPHPSVTLCGSSSLLHISSSCTSDHSETFRTHRLDNLNTWCTFALHNTQAKDCSLVLWHCWVYWSFFFFFQLFHFSFPLFVFETSSWGGGGGGPILCTLHVSPADIS